MRDDEARVRLRLDELRELAPVDAAEPRVEAAPARDAVDVDGDLGRRQLAQLVPGKCERALDLAEDLEVPRGQVRLRHGAGVEHGPLLRQVLARREALRVEAPLDELLLGLGAEERHRVPRLVWVRFAARPRSYVRVSGPDAEGYLQRMVSNDVAALSAGERCGGPLPTPKTRGIGPPLGLCLDERPVGEEVDEEAYERWRVEVGIPRWGREIDDSILPAEAGLTETHVSFTKGCYPGQEPIARQHYRGKVNRRLRVLDVEGEAVPGDADDVRVLEPAALGVAGLPDDEPSVVAYRGRHDAVRYQPEPAVRRVDRIGLALRPRVEPVDTAEQAGSV